jgi:hypothetical protein
LGQREVYTITTIKATYCDHFETEIKWQY